MMNWIFLTFSLFGVVTASNYSYPRILIIGPTGVGKSSLGNVLAGCEPSDEDCFFPICHGADSCTKDTTVAEATFLGQLAGEHATILHGKVTLIDSPGFGDSDNEDSTLIAEMIDVLKNNLEEANTILLCFEGGRFNAGIQKMVEELESLFGRDRLWNSVIIEITKWAFDSKSIADRERQGITEAGTLAEINKKLQENFHLNHDLPGVFIDSYAVYYLESDELQKQYFFNYSMTLWEASNAMEPFSFYTIEDILNQLHTCQVKTDCLNEVIEERITNIENNLTTVTNEIIELTNEVSDNAQRIDDLVVTDSNINDRIDHVNDRLNDNTIKILDNQFEIQTNKKQTDTNKNNIEIHKTDIETNKNSIHSNENNIDSNSNEIDSNTQNIATNRETINKLTETTSHFVSYCAYRYVWGVSIGKLTYEKLVTNINTFHTGGLDAASGIFTPPTQGTYLITTLLNQDGKGHFDVNINLNGHDLGDGFNIHSVYNHEVDDGSSTMAVTLHMTTTDTLYLNVREMGSENINRITYCVTLLK